ncbi:MAG: hypothetical protein JJU33_01315 [Phycisphaerales bacterium]|nr:hypothetical protein [Phycisphaerales bacterium]
MCDKPAQNDLRAETAAGAACVGVASVLLGVSLGVRAGESGGALAVWLVSIVSSIVLGVLLWRLGFRAGMVGRFTLGVALAASWAWQSIAPPESPWPPHAVLDTGPSAGEAPMLQRRDAWGVRVEAFELHADARAAPVRTRSAEIALGPGGRRAADRDWPIRWSFRAAQPSWIVFGPDGRVRPGADGVLLRVTAGGSPGGDVLVERQIDPFARDEDRRWIELEAEVPPGVDRVRLEVLPGPPGSNDWFDRVWIDLGHANAGGRIAGLLDGRFRGWVAWLSRLGALVLAGGVFVGLAWAMQRIWPREQIDRAGPARPLHPLGSRIGRLSVIAGVGVIVGVAAAAAVVATPHADRSFMPVMLNAPGASGATIGDAEADGGPVRLVPGGTEGLLVGVLPPGPRGPITLTVVADPRGEGARLDRLRLFDPRDAETPLLDIDLSERTGGATIEPGEQFGLELDRPRLGVSRVRWGLAFGVGVAALAAMVLVVVRGLLVGVPERHARSEWSTRQRTTVLVVWSLAAIAHLVLAMGLTPGITNDGRVHLEQSIGLLDYGDADTGTPAETLNRLPGYAVWLASALGAGGYAMETVVALQSVALSVAVLGLAMAGAVWIKPWAASAVIVLSLMSPAAISASSSVLPDGLFAALCIGVVACLLAHKRAKRGVLWVLLAGLLSACAVLVRPNGIVLVPLLLAAGVVPVCAAARGAGAGHTLGSGVRAALVFVLAASLPILALVAWSARNLDRFGFAGPTDMGGVAHLQGAMSAGLFDPRALDDDAYDTYARGAEARAFHFDGWGVRSFLGARNDQSEHGFQQRLDDELRSVVERSRRGPAGGLGARLASLGRTAAWSLSSIPEQDFVRRDRNYPWIGVNLATPGQRARRVDPASIDPRLNHAIRPVGPVQQALDRLSGFHPTYHRALLALGTLAALWLFWRGRPEIALPWLLFAGNLALCVLLLNFRPRYVHVLEPLLLMQVALCLSCLLRDGLRRAASPNTGMESKPNP